MINTDKKIVIIGGGPTGLGAAIRLQELGYTNWKLFEKHHRFGGLSATDKGEHNFLWDIGGHVTFSHYNYFDDVINHYVKEWVEHEREAWIWDRDRYIPYPFQNNIHRLPDDDIVKCVTGLINAQKNNTLSVNFGQWLRNTFGKGIYDIFLKPYNEKVWDCHLGQMSVDWMGERVAKVDVNRVIENVIKRQDDVSWGPNSTFKFPLEGGTGSIWSEIGLSVGSNVKTSSEVTKVDFKNKEITYTFLGHEVVESYDYLINTAPIPEFLDMAGYGSHLPELDYTSTNLVGLGFAGKIPEHLKTKCWMYFPNYNQPFYRCTVFSNYSPRNVPKGEYWSLMFEVSRSCWYEREKAETIIRNVTEGAKRAKLIEEDAFTHSGWFRYVKYGYPVPTITRDKELKGVQSFFMENNVYSRGRFGGWKYEVGNMDHSFMQGVEAINNILFGTEESTYFHPNHVNTREKSDSGYVAP
jgi:protoporphyrinogen oxidase